MASSVNGYSVFYLQPIDTISGFDGSDDVYMVTIKVHPRVEGSPASTYQMKEGTPVSILVDNSPTPCSGAITVPHSSDDPTNLSTYVAGIVQVRDSTVNLAVKRELGPSNGIITNLRGYVPLRTGV